MIKKYSWLSFVFALWVSASVWADQPTQKPNVVLFLVDDMGWRDSSAYGSTYYETPHMERFAKLSMKFSQAYAMPLCSPTRACVLTGQSAARHGITAPAGHLPPRKVPKPPKSQTYLDTEHFTIADALKQAGYKTAHYGKWHLGKNPEHWPDQYGFDTKFHAEPSAGPPGGYFSPYNVVPPGTNIKNDKTKYPARFGNITDGPDGEYITDRLTDEAIQFIEKHQDQPFFLNLWHYGVHGPWGHKEEYTKYFANKKDPNGLQGNPIMASMLKSIDDSLGRLIDTLKRLKLDENTLVIFYSDNGGNIKSNVLDPSKPKLNPEKMSVSKRNTFLEWEKWADNQGPTMNTPLRDGKGSLYEGGTRVPLMFSWPGQIPMGRLSKEVVHAYDLYPTILELLNVQASPKQRFDGVSLAGLLKNEKTELDKRPIYNTAQNGYSVHYDGWKLVRFYAEPNEELYHLDQDIGEKTNLAEKHPEKVKELKGMLKKHFEDSLGVPDKF